MLHNFLRKVVAFGLRLFAFLYLFFKASEDGAAHLVQTDFAEELRRYEGAGVLTANTALHSGTNFFANENSHIYQLTNTILTPLGEGIVLDTGTGLTLAYANFFVV